MAKKYPKIKVYGYDPAVAEFSTMPVKKVDLVINTDVLEHIPEDELPETVQRIASLSQNVFFQLHHGAAVVTLPNGENAHCTIWTPQQYAELFSRYFSTINFLTGCSSINTTCLTFDLPGQIKNQWDNLIIGIPGDSIKNWDDFMELIENHKENIIYTTPENTEGKVLLNYLKFRDRLNKICCLGVGAKVDNYEEHFTEGLPYISMDHLKHFRDNAISFIVLPSGLNELLRQLLQLNDFKHNVIIEESVIEQCKKELRLNIELAYKLCYK